MRNFAAILLAALAVSGLSAQEDNEDAVAAIDSLVEICINDAVDWGDGAPHLSFEIPTIEWETELVDFILTEEEAEAAIIDLVGVFYPGQTGRFVRPVYGLITSRYGYRPQFGRDHKGIDLSVRDGEDIRAALGGMVSRVAFDPGGYGNYVILTHSGGLETRYAHLSRSYVVPGQLVSAGTVIGAGGTTGNATGPCLHFETRRFGIPQDPLLLFPSFF